MVCESNKAKPKGKRPARSISLLNVVIVGKELRFEFEGPLARALKRLTAYSRGSEERLASPTASGAH